LGSPKKQRKKYETPMHPWNKERIEVEKILTKKYGLINKKEIMKMTSILASMKNRAKKYIAATGKQAEKEKQHLLNKIQRMGIIEKLTSLDDILGLTVEAIMERRLQTILVRKAIARTMKQSRQFITHQHICVGENIVDSPSYIVSKEEEAKIGFLETSKFKDPEHPERKMKNETKATTDKGKQHQKH
jgi:small subunit ribosomal protein S4